MTSAAALPSAPSVVPPLKIAVVQMTSTEDAQGNLQFLIDQLDHAWKAHGPLDLVSTPENALFLRLHDGAVWPSWTLQDSFFEPLRVWALDHHCAVHIGSVPLVDEKGARVNATLWISDTGVVTSPYQKIHLFDVDVPGAPSVRESAQFRHGSTPHILEYRGWKFGLSICYDLRFAALYQIYQRAQVDAMLVPSAFLVPTGKAHWEILLRARAIESQAFVVAAAQGGTHVRPKGGQRETWGHSMIVDPWGNVLADATESGVTVCVLDHQRIEKVRAQIPMHSHQRL